VWLSESRGTLAKREGDCFVSIVRVGLAENKDFAENYAAIFGGKKAAQSKPAESKPAARSSAKKATARKASARKSPAKKSPAKKKTAKKK
jgi:hypothetical protein